MLTTPGWVRSATVSGAASTARGVAAVAGFKFLDFAVSVGYAEYGLLAGGFDFEGS